jgi:hypothetical protein
MKFEILFAMSLSWLASTSGAAWATTHLDCQTDDSGVEGIGSLEIAPHPIAAEVSVDGTGSAIETYHYEVVQDGNVFFDVQTRGQRYFLELKTTPELNVKTEARMRFVSPESSEMGPNVVYRYGLSCVLRDRELNG